MSYVSHSAHRSRNYLSRTIFCRRFLPSDWPLDLVARSILLPRSFPVRLGYSARSSWNGFFGSCSSRKDSNAYSEPYSFFRTYSRCALSGKLVLERIRHNAVRPIFMTSNQDHRLVFLSEKQEFPNGKFFLVQREKIAAKCPIAFAIADFEISDIRKERSIIQSVPIFRIVNLDRAIQTESLYARSD